MKLMLPLIALFVCVGLVAKHLTPRVYLLTSIVMLAIVLFFFATFRF